MKKGFAQITLPFLVLGVLIFSILYIGANAYYTAIENARIRVADRNGPYLESGQECLVGKECFTGVCSNQDDLDNPGHCE